MEVILTIIGIIVTIWVLLIVITLVGTRIKAKREVNRETEEVLRGEGIVKLGCPNCKVKTYCSIHKVEYMGNIGTVANCTECHKQFLINLTQ